MLDDERQAVPSIGVEGQRIVCGSIKVTTVSDLRYLEWMNF